MTARKLDRRPGLRPEQLALADTRMAFATQLAEALRSARLTARDLGRQLGVSNVIVSYWRLGKNLPGTALRESLVAWAWRDCPDNAPGLQAAIEALPPSGTHAPKGTKPSKASSPLRLVKTPPSERTNAPTPSAGPPDDPPPPPTDNTKGDLMLTREPLSDEVLANFDLESDPFEEPFGPDEGWMGAAQTTTLKRLGEVFSRRTLVALTAEPGSGKSTLLRRLVTERKRSRNVKLLMPRCLDRKVMTPAVLSQAMTRDLTGSSMDSATTERRSEALLTALIDLRDQGVSVVLIIDEAHDLPAATLLFIKRLWDGDAGQRPLGIILCGQPPLANRLQTDLSLRELSMRTQLIALPALGRDAVGQYLAWRCELVHAPRPVFTPAASAALADRCRGSILALHALAARSMAYATTVSDNMVGVDHVGRV